MDVMWEETFGPVVGIMKVASDAEAIAKMNDSKFGLTASVWSADLDKAAESQDYCDEIAGVCRANGVEITELSTHLQGQLVQLVPETGQYLNVSLSAIAHTSS